MHIILISLVSGIHKYHIRELLVIIVHHRSLYDHPVQPRLIGIHSPRRISLVIHYVSKPCVGVSPLQVFQYFNELINIMLSDVLSIFKGLLDYFDGMVHVTILSRYVVFLVQKLTDCSGRHLAIHVQVDLFYYSLVVKKVSISDPQLVVVLHRCPIAPYVTFFV